MGANSAGGEKSAASTSALVRFVCATSCRRQMLLFILLRKLRLPQASSSQCPAQHFTTGLPSGLSMCSSYGSARPEDACSRTSMRTVDSNPSARSCGCVAGCTSPSAVQEDAPPGASRGPGSLPPQGVSNSRPCPIRYSDSKSLIGRCCMSMLCSPVLWAGLFKAAADPLWWYWGCFPDCDLLPSTLWS